MDRTIVFSGAIPQDTDVLSPQRAAMISMGMLLHATFGTSTLVDGLTCAPTGPASMSVQISPGLIMTQTVVDQNDFGSLPADTVDPLVKMGINIGTINLGPITPPSTSGQSQCFLVQTQFAEADTSSVVLPYYNSANPSQPFAGPNNTAVAQYTQRTQRATLQLKAGVAATTGSQTIPAPDSGFVGLWVITVANGATTITSGNIVQYSAAPFITTKLPQMRRRLAANLNLYVSTTGNDSNTGFSTDAAFATRGAAWNYVVNSVDLNGFVAFIWCLDGTYNDHGTFAGAVVGGSLGAGSVVFKGNVSTPDNCFISVTNGSCFIATAGAQFSVQGFKCAATGSGANQGFGLFANSQGSQISFQNCDLASCATADVCAAGGIISMSGPSSVSGSSGSAFIVNTSGNIQTSGQTLTLTSTPSYSNVFAQASGSGNMACDNMTFVGSATGTRYLATLNGVINTGGGGANYLPGNASGSQTTGGQYA